MSLNIPVENVCENKLLTIAIPTFNRKDLLVRAVESIVCQRQFDRIELLISDNASVDGTEKFISERFSAYKNIKYVRNPSNLGPDANYLRCIAECKTRFIEFLSDDDFVEPDSIENVLLFLSNHLDLSVVILNWDLISKENGREIVLRTMYQRGTYTIFHSKESFLLNITLDGLTFISNKVFNLSYFKFVSGLDRFVGSRFIQSYLTLLLLEVKQEAAIIKKVLVHQGVWKIKGDVKNEKTEIESATLIFHDNLYNLTKFALTQLNYKEFTINELLKIGARREYRSLLALRIDNSISASIDLGIKFAAHYKRFKSAYLLCVISSLVPLIILKSLSNIYSKIFKHYPNDSLV